MAGEKLWIVSTSESRPIGEIANDLKAAGLSNLEVLEAIGSITGKGDEKIVPKLRRVKGVTAVEPSLAVEIGPPDSDTFW